MLELFSISTILLFCIVVGIIDAKRKKRIAEQIAERMVDFELSVERLRATAERFKEGNDGE